MKPPDGTRKASPLERYGLDTTLLHCASKEKQGAGSGAPIAPAALEDRVTPGA